MGIVAFCPSGHRVKVKDELAGRKGVCPRCHARFRIPLRSCPLPIARPLGLDAARAAALPRAVILPADHAYLVSSQGGGQGRSGRTSAGPPPRPSQPGLHPLLAAAPGATWYIAIPGGEPTAPFTAAEMQAWLDSGRATGAEVVWRTGWDDWAAVRLVFPDAVPGT